MRKGLTISFLFWLTLALAVGLWVSFRTRSAEKDVVASLEANASKLVTEGRELLHNPGALHLDDGVANLKKSVLPATISRSGPASLIIRDGYLQVMLDVKAPTRVGFRVFSEGVEGVGTRQITNGLWFVRKDI